MKPTNQDRLATDDPCARLERLRLREADGHQPNTEELAFAQDHLSRCEDCRAEQGALALLALDDRSSGAAPALDELSRAFEESKADAEFQDELKEAKIPAKLAQTIGIAVDHRRRKRCPERLQAGC